MVTGTPDGFLGWFSQWGQVIYFAAQMLFWVAIAAAALIVALQYKRFVTYKLGKSEKSPVAAEPSTEVFAE